MSYSIWLFLYRNTLLFQIVGKQKPMIVNWFGVRNMSRPVLDHQPREMTSDIVHRCSVMEGEPRGGPQTYPPGDWLVFGHWYSKPDVGDRYRTSPVEGEDRASVVRTLQRAT